MGPRAALLVVAVLGFAAFAAVAQHTTIASLLSSPDDYRSERDHTDRDNYPHHHPYGDSARICLRKRSIRKCDVLGLFAGVTYESGLECCPSDDQYGNLPRDGDFGKAAKCTWRLEPLLVRTLGTIIFNYFFTQKAPIQVGLFTVDCEFSKVAEQCNDGLCEDMRLSAKGPVWFVPKAAVSGLPVLEGTTPCAVAINQFTDVFRDTQVLSAVGINTTAAEANVTDWDVTAQIMKRSLELFIPTNPGERETLFPGSSQAAAQIQGASSKAATMSSSYSHGQHYEASVVVAYGHVEVKGKHTSKKYDEGFLEATLLYFTKDDWQTGEAKTIVPDDTTFVTEPYKYSITLKNREPYGSY